MVGAEAADAAAAAIFWRLATSAYENFLGAAGVAGTSATGAGAGAGAGLVPVGAGGVAGLLLALPDFLVPFLLTGAFPFKLDVLVRFCCPEPFVPVAGACASGGGR